MTPQVQGVRASPHARRVALEDAFRDPDGRAFGCPEEQPKTRGAAIGGATFGRDAKTSRDGKTIERRPGSEVSSREPPNADAVVSPSPTEQKRSDGLARRRAKPEDPGEGIQR